MFGVYILLFLAGLTSATWNAGYGKDELPGFIDLKNVIDSLTSSGSTIPNLPDVIPDYNPLAVGYVEFVPAGVPRGWATPPTKGSSHTTVKRSGVTIQVAIYERILRVNGNPVSQRATGLLDGVPVMAKTKGYLSSDYAILSNVEKYRDLNIVNKG